MDKGLFTDKVFETIRSNKMIEPGDSVLVGLSGGADSMTLLCFLSRYRKELGITRLAAAHVNHQLRGAEALRDEDFVRNACGQMQIPLYVKTADVAHIAADRGLGVEETGRRVRYAFFEQIIREWNTSSRVATAHTLSDSMETLLLHLARGCGLSGLTGIPPVRGNIIRPLIACTRDEIEKYCEETDISYIYDSTNGDNQYSRNRVRNCIVSELYTINPQVDKAFQRLMTAVQRDENYWTETIEDKWKGVCLANDAMVCRLSCEGLRNMSPALRYRILQKGAQINSDEEAPSLEQKHLDALDSLVSNPGAVTLPGNRRVSSDGGQLIFQKHEIGDTAAVVNCTYPLEIGKSYAFSDRLYRAMLLSLEEYENCKKIHKILLKNALNYDNISSTILIRSRLPGDSYHPVGRQGGKSLKKLFNESKIPSEKRQAVPILCDNQGILLVVGFGCDERVRITPATQTVLVFCEQDIWADLVDWDEGNVKQFHGHAQ